MLKSGFESRYPLVSIVGELGVVAPLKPTIKRAGTVLDCVVDASEARVKNGLA
jgi:hypothetical protein